ncbi:MAG: prolyl oligopeptidase family serine peptidase [Saprospiraceae bacterium]|nr:prolyl oligopeptidase family serine peptidase [Saprospiraceae bacterium]
MIKSVTPNLIGSYGPWANALNSQKARNLSWRNAKFQDIDKWREKARNRMWECLAKPKMDFDGKVKVTNTTIYDGLHIEELEWQLPYGAVTKAYLLRPEKVEGKLPGILAFHDHGANKYFGRRKITKVSDDQHPMMVNHQQEYYEGNAWANEIAKRGYVVLVHDAFTFASRRVLLQDVPEYNRNGLTDENPEDQQNIDDYNDWAAEHEHVMAKSLFSAGTCWPAVFLGEDQVALDILASRQEVDANNLGCAGLSGGGLRTVYMGGMDERIKCAVCVGFMTTWTDFILNKSFTHTWMTYTPLIANDLDFPEILGLRAPLPTLVLNDNDDSLYTLPEMKDADRILKEVYEKAGATDAYRASFYPGPHKFDKAMQKEAFDWFDQWLK